MLLRCYPSALNLARHAENGALVISGLAKSSGQVLFALPKPGAKRSFPKLSMQPYVVVGIVAATNIRHPPAARGVHATSRIGHGPSQWAVAAARLRNVLSLLFARQTARCMQPCLGCEIRLRPKALDIVTLFRPIAKPDPSFERYMAGNLATSPGIVWPDCSRCEQGRSWLD